MRWTSVQDRKLRELVSRFNRLRGVEKRRNPLAEEYLPPKLDYKVLSKQFKSEDRQQWVDFQRSVERANKPNAFRLYPGKFVTNYEVREVQLKERRDYNRMINLSNKKLKEAKRTRNKRKRTRLEGEAKLIKRLAVKTRVDISKVDVRDYMRSLERTNQISLLSNIEEEQKGYYLKALCNGMGLGDGDPLYDFVKGLPAAVVSSAVYYDQYLDFSTPYSPDEVEYLEADLMYRWQRYVDSV